MQINDEAPLVTERDIFIQAPPENVWKVHTDVSTWSEWNKGIAHRRKIRSDQPLPARVPIPRIRLPSSRANSAAATWCCCSAFFSSLANCGFFRRGSSHGSLDMAG